MTDVKSEAPREQQLSESDLRKLAVRHQQYQYQAEALAQQINMVHSSIGEVDLAIKTISDLGENPESKEVMIPVGFDSFIYGTTKKLEKVVIGVGAGVSVEKNIQDAIKTLSTRKEELTRYLEHLNTTFNKLANEMKYLQSVLSRYAQMAQQAQQPQQAQNPQATFRGS